jgi:hypothetical protein
MVSWNTLFNPFTAGRFFQVMCFFTGSDYIVFVICKTPLNDALDQYEISTLHRKYPQASK